MKNSFKKYTASAVLAIAAVLLAGCLGSGGGGTTAVDTTAPTTTAAPSVSGTTETATTLSVTVNEDGTGYYLVLPASAAAPTVAEVQAGTSFALTAHVAATQAISGLTASTAYTIYIVAKDAAGNVQAAVQSVDVTTPDTTAPTTTVAPSVSGTTDTVTTLSVTINEDGFGYYLARLATAPAPTVAEVQAGTSFAMTANVAATPAISGLIFNTPYTIYFVAKDAANNVQAAVQSVAVSTLLSTGYVVQGGLIWTPDTVGSATFGGDFLNYGIPGGYTDWNTANTYCTTATINGVTGWRLPTQPELSALYASGAMNGQGWALDYVWSSTYYDAGYGAGGHYFVGFGTGGIVDWLSDVSNSLYVTCVR